MEKNVKQTIENNGKIKGIQKDYQKENQQRNMVLKLTNKE